MSGLRATCSAQAIGTISLIAALALASCAGSAPSPADAAPRAVEQSSEPWLWQGVPGALIRTEHYRVFTNTGDALLDAVLPGFLERSLTRYTAELGPLPAPSLKLDTFVVRDRAQWATLTREVMGEQAGAFLAIDHGGFASGGRSLLWNIGLRDTLALAAHEGWHQYAQRALPEELPIWLDEAIATYFEGFRLDPAAPGGRVIQPDPAANPQRLDQLRRAAERGTLLTLVDLLDARPTDLVHEGDEPALTYYAQAWALALFLTREPDHPHRRGLADALRDAAQGRMTRWITLRAGLDAAQQHRAARTGPGAFIAYIDSDLAGASRAFDEFTRGLVERGPELATPPTDRSGPSSGR